MDEHHDLQKACECIHIKREVLVSFPSFKVITHEQGCSEVDESSLEPDSLPVGGVQEVFIDFFNFWGLQSFIDCECVQIEVFGDFLERDEDKQRKYGSGEEELLDLDPIVEYSTIFVLVTVLKCLVDTEQSANVEG